jgi:SAM-dependent methyltransferase
MNQGNLDGIDITWDEARATNLANWNDRVGIHVREYGLERYRDDAERLSQVVRTDLAALEPFLPGGVAGLDVCHLQCHIGTDTISLARAGARSVTGVDFSAPALAAAAAFASDLGIDVTWIESDVVEARAAVTARLGADASFDLVYTSIGTIGWLRDLDAWAEQIYALLKPGGTFYIRDGHPALMAMDEEAEGLVTAYRYFPNGLAQQWEETTSYVGTDVLASPRTYEFPHSLAETLTAVLGAGLEIIGFDEGRTLPWRFSPAMVELDDGDFAYPVPLDERVPLTFTLVARKP